MRITYTKSDWKRLDEMQYFTTKKFDCSLWQQIDAVKTSLKVHTLLPLLIKQVES